MTAVSLYWYRRVLSGGRRYEPQQLPVTPNRKQEMSSKWISLSVWVGGGGSHRRQPGFYQLNIFSFSFLKRFTLLKPKGYSLRGRRWLSRIVPESGSVRAELQGDLIVSEDKRPPQCEGGPAPRCFECVAQSYEEIARQD